MKKLKHVELDRNQLNDVHNALMQARSGYAGKLDDLQSKQKYAKEGLSNSEFATLECYPGIIEQYDVLLAKFPFMTQKDWNNNED